jgi:predicted transposase YdaD
MGLTTVEEDGAAAEARYLVGRTRQEMSESASRAIIELTVTIMTYRFENLSQREIEAMLDITLKETRVYREIKEEGREEGVQRERSLVLRLLTRRVGELPQTVRSRVESLSLKQLEELGEALLDFTSLDDLQGWLTRQS